MLRCWWNGSETRVDWSTRKKDGTAARGGLLGRQGERAAAAGGGTSGGEVQRQKSR